MLALVDWNALGRMAAMTAIVGIGAPAALAYAIRGAVAAQAAREDGRPVAVVLGAGLGVAGIVGLLLALYAGFRVGLH